MGNYYKLVPGKPKVPYADLTAAIKEHLDKALLAGLEIPRGSDTIVKAVNTARLGAALQLLKRFPSSGATGEFKTALTERIKAIEAKKLALMNSLEESGDKWGAYKVGSSFLRVFPASKEASKVKKQLMQLKRDKEVKQELGAQHLFLKVAGMVYGSKSKANLKQASMLFSQIANQYSDTEYGEFAKKVLEGRN